MRQLDFARIVANRVTKKQRTLLFLFVIVVSSTLAIFLGIDEKIVALWAILFGLLTQAFAAILGIIALIPWIGPLIVKLLSIPLFWAINATSQIIGVVAVKQGYGKEVASSKLMVVILLTGIIIGYLLGHWFPF